MRRAIAVLLLIVGSGCDDTLFGESAEGAEDLYESDWNGVVELMTDECVSCHIAGGFADELILPDAILDDLESGAGFLVVPGDPSASYLWRVVSGELEPDDYGLMPPAAAPLDEAATNHVKTWISEGALAPISAGTTGTTSR